MNTAAAILGVDHTTVSRRISHLESQLGVRLLDRGGDGWQLTELGRQVAQQAVPIEDALDRVLQVSSGEPADTLRGTIRMTTPDGFGTRFAVPALAEVHRRHPHLTVELITATRQLSLHSAGFDLAIALGSPSSSRLYSETLTPYSLALYAHKDYLADRPPIRRSEDLVDQRWSSTLIRFCKWATWTSAGIFRPSLRGSHRPTSSHNLKQRGLEWAWDCCPRSWQKRYRVCRRCYGHRSRFNSHLRSRHARKASD